MTNAKNGNNAVNGKKMNVNSAEEDEERCPITMNTRKEIIARNGKVFTFKEGNVERVYNANELRKCVKRDGSLFNPLTNQKLDDAVKIRLLDTLGPIQPVPNAAEYNELNDIPSSILYCNTSLRQALYNALKTIFTNFQSARIYNAATGIATKADQCSFIKEENTFWSKLTGSERTEKVPPFLENINNIFGYSIYYKRKDEENTYTFVLITNVRLTKSLVGYLVIPFSMMRDCNSENTVKAMSHCFYAKSSKAINDIQNDTTRYLLLVQNLETQLYPQFEVKQVGGKAKKTHRYNGRSYVVRTGKKGGTYIIVNSKKIYVK
jgi:hypothetical protein